MKDTRASKRQFIVYTETAIMVITRFLAVVFIVGLGDACSWIPKVEQQDFCSAHYGKYYSFILRFIPIMRNNLTATNRHKLIVKNTQNVSSFIVKKYFILVSVFEAEILERKSEDEMIGYVYDIRVKDVFRVCD